MCVLRNLRSPHKHKINHHLPGKPPTQDEDQALEEEDEIKMMSHLKRRTLIKGEMKMIKRLGIKDRHTQESTKQFKEITPSTPYSVTFTRGNH
jgi:hypothetical protein